VSCSHYGKNLRRLKDKISEGSCEDGHGGEVKRNISFPDEWMEKARAEPIAKSERLQPQFAKKKKEQQSLRLDRPGGGNKVYLGGASSEKRRGTLEDSRS